MLTSKFMDQLNTKVVVYESFLLLTKIEHLSIIEQRDTNFLRQSVWLSFLEICGWIETFSHVLLVYASIDKIMDMWLTSITIFSDGGINTRYSPWV
jgi:hypothetical protein